LAEAEQRLEEHRANLEQQGLVNDAIRRVMTPIVAGQSQLRAEVAEYERAKRGEIDAARVGDLGRYLIQARIAKGWSPRDLAAALGVDEALISRDEKDEYQGITKERVQRILDALGVGDSRVASPASTRTNA
jgi:ribosome-binding protein aMBF1 (putative translation factor)